ncbi:hypothetical protein [Roseomonas alba]|nr:hypothetical protein [Neoroseomonas alba]
MIRPLSAALVGLLLLLRPALAQNEPFRVVNGSAQPATALHVVRSGQADWGPNLLGRGPLPPGRAFSLRPPEAAGCHFDFRLVLQDGQEAVRRDADVCAERSISVAPPAGRD